MARAPVYAAGGIVIREGRRPRIAIVQRSKDDHWVLPRGKLKRGEKATHGARREATEETGHRVRVHEFLGAITYRASGRPKVVQFWRMQASRHPSVDPMEDIAAVAWLPLPDAVKRLSYPLEKLFLRHVGREALKRREREAPRKRKKKKHRARRRLQTRRKPNAKPVRRRTATRGKRAR
jgi:8-oxo-dGTP diphosphatase